MGDCGGVFRGWVLGGGEVLVHGEGTGEGVGGDDGANGVVRREGARHTLGFVGPTADSVVAAGGGLRVGGAGGGGGGMGVRAEAAEGRGFPRLWRRNDVLEMRTTVALLAAGMLVMGAARARGDDIADNVFLGEQDLAERLEIWRNQYRRMTPGEAPLVQDVGTWPAAWAEFSRAWATAPAERDLATWLLPIVSDRTGAATILRDANGKALWSGATDFAKEGSESVTLTGALVSEEDWALWQAAREEIDRRLGLTREEPLPVRGTNGPYTNGFRFTDIWAETNGGFRLDFAWESNGEVQVFCRAMHYVATTNTVVYTNDENAVVTNDVVDWRQAPGEKFNGTSDTWALLGVVTVTNGLGSFTDVGFPGEYGRVRFYAAAVLADFDNDGLTDGHEWLVSHTFWDCDDSDQDGLTDGDEENLYGTDPMKNDTDGDGLSDGQEISMGLDPTDPDMDEDGLKDGVEYLWNTDPENPDSDYDGLPDGWEVDNGLDPMEATGADGADGDPDGDGFPNALEFELGAPANTAAWNGNELAWKLMHATPVVVTNGNSVTTNWTGLLVEVEDSWDCVPGGNTNRQNVTTSFIVPDLLDCGYYIEVGIAGSVEDVDANFDKVYFNAYSNNFYFSSHDGIPDSSGPEAEECRMIDEHAVKTNLVFPNSTIGLRYDTVGYRWHSGGYAQVVSAVCVNAASVEVEGPNSMVAGETVQLTASGGGGGPYTWSILGEAATIDPVTGELTAVTNGEVVVTAMDASGCCEACKEISIWSIALSQLFESDAPCNRVPNPKQDTPTRLFVATEDSGFVELCVWADFSPTGSPSSAMCAAYAGQTHLGSAAFDEGGVAELSFAPLMDKQSGISLFVGRDENGNGKLDGTEISETPANFDITAFNENQYRACDVYLGGLATESQVPYPVASSLLTRFLGGNSPPCPFDGVSSTQINCFTQANLTHNAGSVFLESGIGTLDAVVWGYNSTASERIAESEKTEEAINDLIAAHASEISLFFQSNPSSNAYHAVWTTNNAPVDFNRNEPILHPNEFDLYMAFGHATLTSMSVEVVVVKDGQGNLSIASLDVDGVLDDLYDFNFEDGGKSESAATLQLGWDPDIPWRTLGRVFFDRVQFRHAFNGWDYHF